MTLIQALLAEFDQEMANTRRELERIPEDKLSWKPHEKSMTLENLAGHLSEIPGWAQGTFANSEFDMAPVGGPPYTPPVIKSRADVLAIFDKNVKEGHAALEGASDEQLAQDWSLLSGGNKLFTMPKGAVIRTWVLNHNIHHRAQLGVYLRLNNIAVPAIYGPSADEGGM